MTSKAKTGFSWTGIPKTRQLKGARLYLGINTSLSIHVARHSFAVRAINKGISIYLVSKLLGHSTIHSTERTYARFLKEKVDVRTILRRSLETKASAIIIVTNRTDDVVEPDTRDIEITAKISKATKLLEINLLDHVIISATSYYSIADHQAHTLTPEQLNILQEG